MKNYILLACLLASGALIAMEESAGLSKEIMEHSTKQYQLLHALKRSNKPGAKKESLETVKKLLAKKGSEVEIDINFQYPGLSNQTPLMLALWHGNSDVIRLVLSTPGLNASIQDRDERTALHHCVQNRKNIEPLKLLLEQGPHLNPALDLNQRGQDGMTALWSAIHDRNLEAVKLLCQKAEIDANIPTEKYAFGGNYPLHEAMSHKAMSNVENGPLLIRLLADRGARMDCTNATGQTPLSLGLCRLNQQAYSTDGMIALLALGASANDALAGSLDKFSITFENRSAVRRDPSSIFLDDFFRACLGDINSHSYLRSTWLLGGKPNIKDRVYGMTSLMWAAARGKLELAQLLLTQDKRYVCATDDKIDVAATDNFGDTALHYAARNGHAALVQLLLDHSDLIGSIKNNNGKTALDLAKMRDHKAAGRILYKDRVTYLNLAGSLSGLSENGALPRLPREVAELILYFRRIAADPKKTKPKGPAAFISNKINKFLKKQ